MESAGYQFFFHRTSYEVSIGAEAGLAGRFTSSADSIEVWGGVVARYDGITLFDRLNVAPALTFGLSAVSSTLPGRERGHEVRAEGDATVLFYLSPEINLSLPNYSQAEIFWRLHHRSGAWKTLGDMKGGANAKVFGLRVNF